MLLKANRCLLFCLLLLAAVACQPLPPTPTLASLAPSPILTQTRSAVSVLSIATWTPSPTPLPVLGVTRSAVPSPTPFPTNTPFPTDLPTQIPSPSATFSPTPAPSVTPTELPSILPTLDITPMPTSRPGSKLGLHVVRNNSAEIMAFVRTAQPAVIKAVGDVGWLSEVKEASPNTVTVGRLMSASQDMVGDPIQEARDFVADQLSRYLLNPGVDYWEGWNEPDPDEQMAWYAAFEAERVRLLAEYGLKAAVGGFATGVPELAQFYFFLPAVEAAHRHGGILSLHEYGAPTVDYLYGDPLPGYPTYPNRGPLALRYRWYYEDILIPRGTVIPLVISEAGIDGIVMSGSRPGPNGLGWKDFVGYWESIGLGNGPQAYINQLAWYDSEVRKDHYVIGFTVFTAGGGGDYGWSSYDINEILPELTEYVVQHP